ncbi:MAG TPA: phosphoribosylanthranilate isomerase [Longimicrobiales bacterium]|nr:phosphoribosylanthranilate isomerase [Longimicrobiales bacterium]
MNVAVKVCGLCRREDARVASEAGAAWIGVILAPGRSRSQTVAQAGVILEGAAARRVGVFVDAPAAAVAEAARDLSLDAVQLHGDESAADVRTIRSLVTCEVWKALRVRDADAFTGGARTYAEDVDALLLDGWSPTAHGGTGTRFDWAAVAAAGVPPGVRLIVAGGLAADNVAEAIALLRPSIVDVSSGVESATGVKSPEKIHAFVAAARGVRIEQ